MNLSPRHLSSDRLVIHNIDPTFHHHPPAPNHVHANPQTENYRNDTKYHEHRNSIPQRPFVGDDYWSNSFDFGKKTPGSPIPNLLSRAKRSSSTSYDLVYERDRFRTRTQQINGTQCDVCDGIGTKTTKLNVNDSEEDEQEQIDFTSTISPLDPQSSFYKDLPTVKFTPNELEIVVKLLNTSQLCNLFKWYFAQPLPNTTDMFPWLHGLNKDNFAQKQFFLYQQHQLQESNIFSQFTLDKPKNIRFLMCINMKEDPKKDINNNILYGSTPSSFTPLLSIKNTIKSNEVLQQINVSKIEVRNMIQNLLDDMFNIEDDAITDMFTKDCIKVNFLPVFLNLDPDRGVSLRNFHIQVSKLSTCSDFIVYGAHQTTTLSYTRVLWLAQQFEAFKEGISPQYNVFVFDGSVDQLHEDVIWSNDFQIKEKIEITKMSSATKINRNVWVGNYWDYNAMISNLLDKSNEFDYSHQRDHLYCDPLNSIVHQQKISGDLSNYLPKPKANWKLFMHCHSDATFPSLSVLSNLLFKYTISSHHDENEDSDYHLLEFPPSGSIGIGDCKKENLMSILNTCKLIYLYSSSSGNDPKVLSTLIYCSDGYTELSLFVLCYLMYSLNIGLADAMLKLHLEFGRPFYIFNSDVLILNKLEGLLNKFSPKAKQINWGELETISNLEINELLLGPSKSPKSNVRLGFIENDDDEHDDDPEVDELVSCNWVNDVEGSMPSQILPYIYLGSLKHANCLPLLNKLGIKKIISVGENLDWLNGSIFRLYNEVSVELEDNGNIELFHIKNKSDKYPCSIDTVMKVNNLQDDGIDELSRSLPRILRFIDDQYVQSDGETKILVHCRVGVSRSATVVIAEVMRRLNITISHAYLYVRVRRLNIIIQPNLRFMYELFKWEEQEKTKTNATTLRDIDWFIMCREIMKLNLPYLNN